MNTTNYKPNISGIENLLAIYFTLSKKLTKAIHSKTDFTPLMSFLLSTLERNGSMTMSEIGSRLSMSKPNVTKYIDKLVKEKMMERFYDENDRRTINIRLTNKGKDDLGTIRKAMNEEMQPRMARLSPEKLAQLHQAAETIHDIISELVINK